MEKSASILPAQEESHLSGARRRWKSLLGAVRTGREDPLACRARRVILMLGFIWMVSLFDLAMTLLARQIGGFEEANPVARPFIEHTGAVVVYKLVILIPCTLIVMRYRRRRLTEIGCWFLTAVYTALAFLWSAYYQTW